MKIVAFDRDPRVTTEFANAGLATFTGDVRDIDCAAVVSPANSFGFMDGGIDYAYSNWLGWDVQDLLQTKLQSLPFGELLVGQALAVETSHPVVRYVISAPTMRVPKRILDPCDVMLATRAAVHLALSMNLPSLAIPGMGTGCGELAPQIAAMAIASGVRQGMGEFTRPTSWREAQARHFQMLA